MSNLEQAYEQAEQRYHDAAAALDQAEYDDDDDEIAEALTERDAAEAALQRAEEALEDAGL